MSKAKKKHEEPANINGCYFAAKDIRQEIECMKLEGKSTGYLTHIDVLRKWTHPDRSNTEVSRGTRLKKNENLMDLTDDGDSVVLVDSDQIELGIDRDESKRKVVELKASLKGRELEIVEHMERGLTLEKVGEAMNLTGPRISQILLEIRTRFGEQ